MEAHVDTRDLIGRIDHPLGGIELSELIALRDWLEEGRAAHEARLGSVEARKHALFADGISHPDIRGQQARARQIQDMELEAEQVAALLRIAHKQRLLLDQLIWLRENLAALERLRATTPAAVPVDWLGLLDATATIPDDEARLDQLTTALTAAGRDLHPAVPPSATRPTTRTPPDTSPVPPAEPGYLVTRVLDGGTIELAGGQRVRYIGVDCPAMRNALGQADAGAWEAREANRKLVANRRVRLEADRLDTDTDGAWWRYVYVGDRLVNAELLRQGVVSYIGRYPNTRLAETLLDAEREARRHRRGVWKVQP